MGLRRARRRRSYPLLLHYHPLVIYRHQVIKQADVVLATFLLGDQFSDEQKRRNFDYYDPLTTGDSTLSACVQSVVAAEVGYDDAALDYFLDACAVDLLDLHGNTADGVHVASGGGTWLALVAGFGGLRDADGDVRFNPRLPAAWDRLRFRVQVRGQLIEVDMTAARRPTSSSTARASPSSTTASRCGSPRERPSCGRCRSRRRRASCRRPDDPEVSPGSRAPARPGATG